MSSTRTTPERTMDAEERTALPPRESTPSEPSLGGPAVPPVGPGPRFPRTDGPGGPGRQAERPARDEATGGRGGAGGASLQPGGVLPRRLSSAIAIAAAVLAAVLVFVTDRNPALVVVAVALLAGVAIVVPSALVEGRRRATDRAVTYGVTIAFGLAMAPLLSLLWTVITRGTGRFDPAFFTETMRNVIGDGGGAAHAIVGTLLITGVATLVAVPVGVLAAIYLQEYGRGPLKRWLTFFVDVMTGIPSIVAGLFAFALFSLVMGPGAKLGVMGSVALAVLMIPIVVRSTEEMLKIVPNGLREASYALGVPKWRTILKVVLPTSLAGVVTGVMVAVARVMGETAPLLITTGVFASMNVNPFDGRMMNLPVFAFNQYKSPGIPRDPFFDRAWAAALTLIVLVMLLNLVARLIYRRFGTEIR